MLVAEFPASSNAYDSLGEAYLKNGNLEQAKKNYEKSLALNADNFNAEDQIELILFPDKVQLPPTEKFKQVFLAEAYKQDLEQLGNTLLKIHPNALKFISKEKFWQAIESKKELITDSTTFGEFAWMCSEIIANVPGLEDRRRHCAALGIAVLAQVVTDVAQRVFVGHGRRGHAVDSARLTGLGGWRKVAT